MPRLNPEPGPPTLATLREQAASFRDRVEQAQAWLDHLQARGPDGTSKTGHSHAITAATNALSCARQGYRNAVRILETAEAIPGFDTSCEALRATERDETPGPVSDDLGQSGRNA